MCDVTGCVFDVDVNRVGRTRDGREVNVGLCVRHRQSFDSGETLRVSAGDVHE